MGKGFSKSTVDKFNTSLAHLKDYILYRYKTTDILLSDIDGNFIREFDFYLKTKKNCQQNTVVKHLKNLKKIIRIAISNDWIQKDPFMGIQFKHEEVQVDFLTQEELNRLILKEFEITRLEQIRDVFVFCCYTGLAFIDVKNLREEHLVKDNQGQLWIRKQREKTGVMCNIPVLTPAKALLDKYGNNPECVEKGQLLPVISNQRVNAYLKEIADLCGITKKLTTHTARHMKYSNKLYFSALQSQICR
ncbi:site-specific integrase [Petrimonas sp.]|uniref:site-specific integrase n=1 Tax=Petrimonas sp. TaxID=2023866 RepID=UPI003F50FA08